MDDVHGSCDARFAGVRAAFAANLRERGELGAAVAVVLDGMPVVDLWGGWADATRTRPWEEDTLVDVFSAGKPMAALVVLQLVERGLLALDAPVARWWPGFAAAGKDAVTLRMVLAHRAGLPAIRAPLETLAMYDPDAMAAALAAEAPWWAPGERHGYHVTTFGFVLAEVVRRATGTTIGAVFRREIAAPLAADLHFGIGPADDARIAEYVFADDSGQAVDGEDEARRTLLRLVYANPPGVSGFGTVNTRAWRAAEMPSTNGHANARALARAYAALAGGGPPIVGADTLARATAEHAFGPDAVLGRPTRFGLGFQLPHAGLTFGPGARSFGHFGAGGSLGFADPDARLAFGYAMNRGGPRWYNPRTRALIDATYASL